MKICKIGLIAIVSCMIFPYKSFIYASESDKREENSFYFVKYIQCSPLPENWLSFNLKFSDPKDSLDDISFIKSLKFKLTQYYKIDATGKVEIHDSTELSTWKSVNKPSLSYTSHLKNEMNPYKGTKENIFDVFVQKNMEFGNYVMNINLHSDTDIDFTFSALPESNKKF